MDEIKKIVEELLKSETIQVFIGYGEGTAGLTRPLFIARPEDAGRLVFDSRCHHNLASYVLKHEVKHFGKIGILGTIPIMRSLLQMASEKQIADGEITVLAVTSEAKIEIISSLKNIEQQIANSTIGISSLESERIHQLEALSPEERWNFWTNEFSRCFRCYACRQSCPLCFCVRCNTENNQPQWIPVPAHQAGNFEWHIMRAMHLAGRCVNCGECARACPADIPLNLLTYALMGDIEKEFGQVAGLSAIQESVLSSYKVSDKENFIL